jgi:hypothetical protein
MLKDKIKKKLILKKALKKYQSQPELIFKILHLGHDAKTKPIKRKPE